MFLSFVDSSHHYGEGLRRAILSGPQYSNCFIVRGVTGQEKTTQSFDGQDFSLLKKMTGSRYRIGLVYYVAVVINQLDPGTTFRAGIWLSMKASIQRIVIFRLALRAHLEVAHGGLGAVIWHTLNYGKPWATISAVGKGIPVTAVFRT